MKGIEVYESRYGLPVMRIHYTADPERDPATEAGREWLQSALRGIPGGMQSSHWRQEQEIDWEAAGGDLVFPQLGPYRDQVVCDPMWDTEDIPDGFRYFASFDYGIRNPSAFHVHAIDYDQNIFTVWEWYKSGVGYRDQARAIRACPYWDKLSYLPIADPSIYNVNQQTETGLKSVGQLFMSLPEHEQIIFAAGKRGGDVAAAARINGDLWAGLEKGEEPKWKIWSTCPKMIWEVGKLRWADWSATQQQGKGLREEIVDRDNHAWDGFKMFLTAFFEGPIRQEEKPYDRLKSVDPISYREWMNVEKLHRENAPAKGATMGEFG